MHKLFASGAAAPGAALLALAMLTSAPATAATVSGTLPVSANVTANCTLSTSALAFGNVNVIGGANVDNSGGLTVTCTSGTAWSASAGVGVGLRRELRQPADDRGRQPARTTTSIRAAPTPLCGATARAAPASFRRHRHRLGAECRRLRPGRFRPDHGPGRQLCRYRGRDRHLLNSAGHVMRLAPLPLGAALALGGGRPFGGRRRHAPDQSRPGRDRRRPTVRIGHRPEHGGRAGHDPRLCARLAAGGRRRPL